MKIVSILKEKDKRVVFASDVLVGLIGAWLGSFDEEKDDLLRYQLMNSKNVSKLRIDKKKTDDIKRQFNNLLNKFSLRDNYVLKLVDKDAYGFVCSVLSNTEKIELGFK